MPEAYLNFIESTDYRDVKIFDGKMPSRRSTFFGVTICGNIIDFVDTTIPSKLLNALLQERISRQGRKGKHGFNGYYFAAAMRGQTVDAWHAYDFRVDPRSPVTQNDFPSTDVAIGCNHPNIPFILSHILVPAHLDDDPNTYPMYLHKLAFDGPVCLSSMETAMRLTKSTQAYETSRIYIDA